MVDCGLKFGPTALITTASMTELRIGVDVGGTKIEAVVLEPGRGIIARQRTATPRGQY